MESTFTLPVPAMECQEASLEAPKNHKLTALTSKLEKHNGINWIPDEYPLYKYKGFWYSEFLLEGALEGQELLGQSDEYSLSSSDIIICSSMKSGVTWLKALAFSIVTRTRFDPFSPNHPLSSTVPHDLIPFIEIDIGRDHTPRKPDLPLLSTHLPYSVLPDPMLSLGCKIVYISRNPKDVFVSMWHYLQKASWGRKDLPLEEACNLFCKGVSLYGSYWDHVLEYWKASLDRPDKVMFLKYEDMMIDTELHVRRMADFMGYPFSTEEEKKGVAKRIAEMCGFESLSNLEVNKTGNHRGEDIAMANSAFFRKGKVNDWVNYLSEEMASKFEKVTVEKLAGSGLTL